MWLTAFNSSGAQLLDDIKIYYLKRSLQIFEKKKIQLVIIITFGDVACTSASTYIIQRKSTAIILSYV